MRLALHCFSVFLGLAWSTPALAGAAIPEDNASAVILAYHRIDEDAYPDSSLRADQFAEHIQTIIDDGYNIMTLPAIIAALKKGENLPPQTLAITFEGGFRSAYENAVPLLLEKKIPFTVFFASDYADNESDQHIGWDELKSLAGYENVTLGILPAAYMHLSDAPREEILSHLNKARARYREKLGGEPQFFSYPFGEISLAFKNIVKEQGFTAAFGQHAGTASIGSDLMALPRFTMTEIYGDLERFQLVATALPLPAQDVEPADPLLDNENPVIGFSLPSSLAPEASALSCFVSGQAQPKVEILGENRVELRLAEPLSEERTRVNCTVPGPQSNAETQTGWRWFGMMLVAKTEKSVIPEQAGLQ